MGCARDDGATELRRRRQRALFDVPTVAICVAGFVGLLIRGGS
jgi:hypothetical protein